MEFLGYRAVIEQLTCCGLYHAKRFHLCYARQTIRSADCSTIPSATPNQTSRMIWKPCFAHRFARIWPARAIGDASPSKSLDRAIYGRAIGALVTLVSRAFCLKNKMCQYLRPVAKDSAEYPRFSFCWIRARASARSWPFIQVVQIRQTPAPISRASGPVKIVFDMSACTIYVSRNISWKVAVQTFEPVSQPPAARERSA
jgi:hypothetical protein